MALKDLTETGFDPDLHLPIRGKTYTVVAPDYEAHKEMQETIVATGLPPVEQSQQAIDALGSAFGEMVDDGVPWPMILHAGRTTLLHFGFSPDMAEVHWALAHLGRMVDLEQVSQKLGDLERARARARKKHRKED